jgi:serine/threonine-protein kinase
MPLRRRQLVGRFRVLAHLAQSGTSDVYRAIDTHVRDEVALKVARERDGSDLCASAAREVHTLRRLAHPHVLPVRAAQVWRGRWVFATPLGVSDLAGRLTRRMSAERARGLALQLLEGLAFAHEHHVAHLDVKPQNAILFAGDRLCLSDFGIARRLTRPCWASGSGTIGYLAPEQALGRPSLRSDVFSAGLVVWELFARHVPMWPFAWPYPGAARIEGEHGAAVLGVLRRATAVRESLRFAHAGAFHAALRSAFAGARSANQVDASASTHSALRKRAARVRRVSAPRAA